MDNKLDARVPTLKDKNYYMITHTVVEISKSNPSLSLSHMTLVINIVQ